MKTKSLEKCLFFLVVALSTIVLFNSCHKDEISFPDPSTLPKGLTGSWVETTTGVDTISFNSNNEAGYFNLYRGFAITNGYRLPKIGSTSYSYTISGNSISVVPKYGLSVILLINRQNTGLLKTGDYYNVNPIRLQVFNALLKYQREITGQ